MSGSQDRFDEEFDRIMREENLDNAEFLHERHESSSNLSVAHSLVDCALHLIRAAAPRSLSSGQAWLGSIRILGDMAHGIASGHLAAADGSDEADE